jgi:HSP20 family protein
MAQQPVTKASGTRAPARTSGDPFTAFRREMDRMFEDFLSGFGLPMMRQAGIWEGGVLAPRIETSETDEEISVSAELPGIDEKDIDVTLGGDVLTIRARKEAESEEEDRDYHLTERSYGTFLRTLRLPFAVDPQGAEASFRNGVLTITIPKPKQGEGPHRIEVKPEQGAGRQRVDRAAAGGKPGAESAERDAPGTAGEEKRE